MCDLSWTSANNGKEKSFMSYNYLTFHQWFTFSFIAHRQKQLCVHHFIFIKILKLLIINYRLMDHNVIQLMKCFSSKEFGCTSWLFITSFFRISFQVVRINRILHIYFFQIFKFCIITFSRWVKKDFYNVETFATHCISFTIYEIYQQKRYNSIFLSCGILTFENGSLLKPPTEPP